MSASRAAPTRPLPARPNLEFERKRAKRLLRDLRQTDQKTKLADAQFRIAHEYGFADWPRLVEYFEATERQDRSLLYDEGYPPDHYEQRAQSMLRQLRARSVHAMPLVCAFVPRFYAARPEDIPASEITLDDARLIVARNAHCPSWEVLIERARKTRAERPEGWRHIDTPLSRANRALNSGDLDAAGAIIDQHPELLQPATRDEPSRPGSLLGSTLYREWKNPGPGARRVSDWLVARGADLRSELGRMLAEIHLFDIPNFAADGTRVPDKRTRAEYVAFLLERGADPTWLPPNGITILEHVMLRCHDGSATDLVAKSVKPPQAFWIAAGLGNVAAVSRYVNRDGTLRDAARRNRPDFLATHVHAWWTQVPNASERDIILEAFFVAAMNQRWAVLDLLLDRGFPIDYSPWGTSILPCFFQPPQVAAVEYFVRRGANLDLTMSGAPGSIRDYARMMYASQPTSPEALRILELCGGGEPAEVLKAYEAELGPRIPATVGEHLDETFALARNDARRMGRAAVEPDNLFVALLSGERTLPLAFLGHGDRGADLVRLRGVLGDRLAPQPAHDAVELPLGDAARRVIAAATAMATESRSPTVSVLHVLKALVQSDTGPVSELLNAAGGSAEYVREALKGAI